MVTHFLTLFFLLYIHSHEKSYKIEGLGYIDGSSSVNRINGSLVISNKQAGAKWRFICIVYFDVAMTKR